MVAVRVVSFGVEVAAEGVETVALHRQAIEVASSIDASGRIRVVEFGIEVAANVPFVIALHRQAIEVAASPGVSGRVRVVELGVEVAAATLTALALHRQAIEVAATPGVSGAIRVVSLGIEVIARVPATVTPGAFPAEFDLFMHNWASRLQMETSYSTDITGAVETVAEERRSLINKPYRSIKFLWTESTRETIDKLMRHLRRLGRNQLAVPLYQDQTVLLESVGPPTDTIICDTLDRRFFSGMLIVLAQVDPGDYEFTGTWQHARVLTRFTDHLILTTTVTNLVAGEWLIFPVMNTEIHLSPEIEWITNYVANVRLQVEEVIGISTLPPVQTGNPDGYVLFEGNPIWNVDPNWKDNLRTTFLREGDQYFIGKGRLTFLRGERHRVIHDFGLLMERPDFFMFLRLFDTCRGRARPFWQVDVEDIWQCTAIDASGSFVDFDPLGDFIEFQRELGQADNGTLGLIFKDGTVLLRRVANITEFGGNWRVTVNPSLPVNLDCEDVLRASRARLVRFFEDAMSEEWVTAETVIVRTKTIEVLEEGTVTL